MHGNVAGTSAPPTRELRTDEGDDAAHAPTQTHQRPSRQFSCEAVPFDKWNVTTATRPNRQLFVR